MKNEIYKLYKEAFPNLLRSEETIKKILSDKNNHIIDYSLGDKLIGASVINENTVYLLCIDKAYQNKGIGTELLTKSEEFIRTRGFDKIKLGAGKDYIMPGVPMNNNAHKFFKKHGYIHSWGDCGCFDMCQELADFNCNEYAVGDIINGINYRWAGIKDLDSIIICVSAAEADFVRYYNDEWLYNESTNTPVLIAEKDGEVQGAIIVSIETDGKGIGSVGCTATAPRYRNKGIATNLVKLSTGYLKQIGLDKAWLGYTYTDILGLYGRAGYKVSMEYFMGEKIHT